MAKFATNASGAMMLLNLIQVTESISGSVVPLAMFEMCALCTLHICLQCCRIGIAQDSGRSRFALQST